MSQAHCLGVSSSSPVVAAQGLPHLCRHCSVARSLRKCSDAIFATTLYSDDVVQRSVLGVCVHSVFDTGRKAWEIGSTFMLFVSPRR